MIIKTPYNTQNNSKLIETLTLDEVRQRYYMRLERMGPLNERSRVRRVFAGSTSSLAWQVY